MSRQYSGTLSKRGGKKKWLHRDVLAGGARRERAKTSNREITFTVKIMKYTLRINNADFEKVKLHLVNKRNLFSSNNSLFTKMSLQDAARAKCARRHIVLLEVGEKLCLSQVSVVSLSFQLREP